MTRSTGRPISRRMTTGTPTTACCEQVEVHVTSPSDTWATRVRAPAKTKQTTVRTRRVEAGEGEGEGEGVYLVCGGRFRWARRPRGTSTFAASRGTARYLGGHPQVSAGEHRIVDLGVVAIQNPTPAATSGRQGQARNTGTH